MFDLVHDIQGLLDKALIIGQPGERVASEINLLLRKFLALLPCLWLSIGFVMELRQNNTVCCSKSELINGNGVRPFCSSLFAVDTPTMH